jgi:hypothetical protein
MSKKKRGTPKGNCDTCSWAALSVEIAKETDGGGGTGKNDAPAETVTDLARELFNIGCDAAESAGTSCWTYDDARPAQKEAAHAIAAHVLKHFTRKARP